MPDDKIQREIEEILNRLDEFVPEEKATERARRRSSKAAAGFGHAFLAPLSRISIRHVMLTAFALIVVGFFARVHPLGLWMLVAGLILFLTAFALSFVSRGSPPKVEKRWRGQTIELGEPSLSDRLRTWLQAKRRPRR